MPSRPHLEQNCLIRVSQHGFREGRSCLTNLLSFLDKVTDYVNEGTHIDVTATADVSGCSVWICGTCDAKASSYLGSGRMTEVIRLALYTEVLGPWDSDCAGGRLLSTDTGLADLLPLGVLNTSALSTISSYGSISISLSSMVTNEDKTCMSVSIFY